MAKIETAAQREEKIRGLTQNIAGLAAGFYDKATDDQRKELWIKLDDLERAMIDYRNHEESFDSCLIQTTLCFEGKSRSSDKEPWKDGVRVKTTQTSTFDSVMDKARDIYAWVVTQK